MKKKKNKEFDVYEEDTMNLASKEEELLDSYKDEVNITYEDDTEYDEPVITEVFSDEDDFEDEEVKVRKGRRLHRFVNVLFTIIMIALAMIAIDVICVARYNVGPFFAIPLHAYNDGGSKAYYGIGYKVIKYHQTQGRRDKTIGTWSLKYDVEPTTLKDIDLSIEIQENGIETYKKYYKKFVRIISTLEKVDEKNNTITIGYTDEDNKYTLEIHCSMVSEQKDLEKLKKNEEITIIGTLTNFKGKTDKKPNRIYISDCFAEQ